MTGLIARENCSCGQMPSFTRSYRIGTVVRGGSRAFNALFRRIYLAYRKNGFARKRAMYIAKATAAKIERRLGLMK